MENFLRTNNIMFHEKERKIKKILKDESNNKCIDCNNGKPDYISLNNACFICKNCFKRHQKFPFNISKKQFIRIKPNLVISLRVKVKSLFGEITNFLILEYFLIELKMEGPKDKLGTK